MKYFDKSTGRTVTLSETPTDFLVMTEPGDGEAALALFSQRVFRIVSSTNNDGVYIARLKSDQESPVEVEKTLTNFRADDRIRFVVPAVTDEEGLTRFMLPDRVVVRFRGLSDRQVQRYVASVSSRVVTRYRTPGLYELAVPDGQPVGDFIATLNQNDAVAFVEPQFYAVEDADIRITVTRGGGAPPDGETNGAEGDNLSWNLSKIALAQAWMVTTGGPEVIVAVVDGWPAVDHEALTGKLLTAPDKIPTFTSDTTVSSHATNICSVLTGESARLTGVAPGVKLLPLVVNLFSQVYAERADAIYQAAEIARRQEVDGQSFARLVLSCSWRTAGDITVIRDAFEEAISAGVLVVCSAGNTASSAAHYPSSYSSRPGPLGEGLISVAATDAADRKASYSNFARTVDLCAPGGDGLPLDSGDIPCADLDNTYTVGAGTSLAVPHVAGIAALMLSADPALSPRRLKELLKATADPLDARNPEYAAMLGAGRLNAGRALAAIAPAPAADARALRARLATLARAFQSDTGWALVQAQVRRGLEDLELVLD